MNLFIVVSVAIVHIAVSGTPSCTPEERAVWRDDYSFTEIYQAVSLKCWGNREKTLQALVAELGASISSNCLDCLAVATSCGVRFCAIQCAINAAYPMCQNCVTANCKPALLECTGAEDVAALPLAPTLPPSLDGDDSDNNSDNNSDINSDDNSDRNSDSDESQRNKSSPMTIDGRQMTMSDNMDEDSFVLVEDEILAESTTTSTPLRHTKKTKPQRTESSVNFTKNQIAWIISGVVLAVIAAGIIKIYS